MINYSWLKGRKVKCVLDGVGELKIDQLYTIKDIFNGSGHTWVILVEGIDNINYGIDFFDYKNLMRDIREERINELIKL